MKDSTAMVADITSSTAVAAVMPLRNTGAVSESMSIPSVPEARVKTSA